MYTHGNNKVSVGGGGVGGGGWWVIKHKILKYSDRNILKQIKPLQKTLEKMMTLVGKMSCNK